MTSRQYCLWVSYWGCGEMSSETRVMSMRGLSDISATVLPRTKGIQFDKVCHCHERRRLTLTSHPSLGLFWSWYQKCSGERRGYCESYLWKFARRNPSQWSDWRDECGCTTKSKRRRRKCCTVVAVHLEHHRLYCLWRIRRYCWWRGDGWNSKIGTRDTMKRFLQKIK